MIGTGIGLGLSGFTLQRNIFKPDQISGLELWLDAADSETLYQSAGGSLASADGDPVGQWKDKSGNARHAAQTDGTKKPLLKLALQNSKNLLRWDGVNDTFSISGSASSLSFLTNGDSSFFAVFSTPSVTDSFSLFNSGGGSTIGKGIGIWTYLSKIVIQYKVSGSGGSIAEDSSSVSISANEKILFTSLTNLANATPANRLFLKKNGGAYSNANSSSASVASGNMTYDFFIGSFNNQFFQGMDCCELIIYSSKLSNSDAALVQSYLNAKWGIY